MSDTWEEVYAFWSTVYKIHKPEFLENVKTVTYEYLENARENFGLNEIYPVLQTMDMSQDQRLADLVGYINQTSWNILDSQGYDVSNKLTQLNGLWAQQHYKTSSMEFHAHENSYIVGAFFLETPENSPPMVFHDVRTAKIQLEPAEKNDPSLKMASKMLFLKPEAGNIFFANSWLPHSFPRNASEFPFTFLHFIVNVYDNQNNCCPTQTEQKSPVIV